MKLTTGNDVFIVSVIV